MEITETILLDAAQVRSLCMEHNYYTAGVNSEYIKMLEKVTDYNADNLWDVEAFADIAKDIVAHTNPKIFYSDCLCDYDEMIAHVMFLLSRKANRLYEVA